MKVCHTVFQNMPFIDSLQAFRNQFPAIPALLKAQQEIGLQPCWMAFSSQDAEFIEDGIKVRMVRGNSGMGALGSRLRFLRALSEESPDVVHQHGLNSYFALLLLGSWIKKKSVSMFCRIMPAAHRSLRSRGGSLKKPLALPLASFLATKAPGTIGSKINY